MQNLTVSAPTFGRTVADNGAEPTVLLMSAEGGCSSADDCAESNEYQSQSTSRKRALRPAGSRPADRELLPLHAPPGVFVNRLALHQRGNRRRSFVEKLDYFQRLEGRAALGNVSPREALDA